MPPFLKGLELSELFFNEQVTPILHRSFPGLKIAAGRLDYGSEVLGYDTEQSRDHAWGPQVTLFLSRHDLLSVKDSLDQALQEQLPRECKGYPTRMSRDFIWHPTPDGSGHHRVRIESIESFFNQQLGWTPTASMSHADWLAIPAQKLRVIASGKIFRDDLGEITALRDALHWYPHDIWLHIMACQWQNLLQCAPVPGRCAHVADSWGAAINTSDSIHGLALLAHLLEQRYPPYRKWLGSSLRELSIGPSLIELTTQALAAGNNWPAMEDATIAAYQLIATKHNSVTALPKINPNAITFHDRPYRVIDIDSIVSSLKESIANESIRNLPLTACALWQFSNFDPALCSNEASLRYREMLPKEAM
jgi:hypothetical protein